MFESLRHDSGAAVFAPDGPDHRRAPCGGLGPDNRPALPKRSDHGTGEKFLRRALCRSLLDQQWNGFREGRAYRPASTANSVGNRDRYVQLAALSFFALDRGQPDDRRNYYSAALLLSPRDSGPFFDH